MKIRVLTYNIRHGLGSDSKQDLSRILPALTESRADIICLQEVDKGLPRSGFAHQAAWLGSRLGFSFAHENNFGLPMAGMGNALLSRWPFYSTWNKKLPAAGEPRGLIGVEIDHPDIGTLAFFCTHWGLSEAQRLDQARACAGHVNAIKMPCVLSGDLNATPGSADVALLLRESKLQDAGPDNALTYPADRPEAKIDYILVSQQWTVAGAGVMETLASDHRPVYADLSL
jgi:endonuclease/exonuclease/phosphatase family metal-dependent hydrolase